MSARSTTPSLIGTPTLWRTPTPNCAGLGVQDGVNGDALVLRTRLVPALRRDRTVAIPHLLRALLTTCSAARFYDIPCRLTTPYSGCGRPYRDGTGTVSRRSCRRTAFMWTCRSDRPWRRVVPRTSSSDSRSGSSRWRAMRTTTGRWWLPVPMSCKRQPGDRGGGGGGGGGGLVAVLCLC